MYDVIIIGAGIVGCAVARALSRYDLRILVIEKGADVAVGATKANSGILHAGYDCAPGSLKAEMNVRGLQLYKTLVQELAIPHRMNGSLVVSTADAAGNGASEAGAVGLDKLRALYEQGLANGVEGLELLDAAQAHALEPNLHPSVNGALRASTAGIISPYEAAIAFAESAAINGVEFLLESTVTAVRTSPQIPNYMLSPICREQTYLKVSTVRPSLGYSSPEEFAAYVVINAAGIDSGVVANRFELSEYDIFGDRRVETPPERLSQYTIHPQRGQYYLLDNTQRDLITHTVFQLPTHKGKGVLIAPTVDDNVLLGPTAEAIDDAQYESDPSATETTRDGLAEALDKARLTLAHVPISDRITAFAGIRAKHSGGDFILEETQHGFFHAVGIDSPGLTAAPAIAERLAEMVLARLEQLALDAPPDVYVPDFRQVPKLRTDFVARRDPITRLRDLPPDAQARLVAANPAYGSVVCRCETVTQAEITEAMRRFAALQAKHIVCRVPRPIPANLDAIKRRCRAQMGRCQGGFCTVRLVELIAREYGLPETAVTKNGFGTTITPAEVNK